MPFVTLADTKDKSFDYIIIGGGTAGLALAARLTEDANTNVLVLEAGEEHLDDPLVDRPWGLMMQLGNPKYDWFHKTTPQKYANGKQYPWHRGKGLGGSSALNLAFHLPPHSLDVDYWEKLGNPGWNYKDYKKYLDRAISYRPAHGDKAESDIVRLREDTGHGPVKLSYSSNVLETEIKLQKTLLDLGIPKATTPITGDPTGTYLSLTTLDPETHKRSYSASAYYVPNASRPNFSVLLGAYATRIVTQGEGEGLTATGVEFAHGESRDVHVTHARKEVVLCAGALKSPQILELSGIGRPSVLSSIGVPVKLALDGVGENVQEHYSIGISYQLKDNITDDTWDLLRDPEQVTKHGDLHPTGKGAFNAGPVNVAFVPLDTVTPHADKIYDAERAIIRDGIASGKYSASLAEQYELQMDRAAKKGPGCEFALFPGFLSGPEPPVPGKRYFTFYVFTNYAFSRGTIHCSSSDPHEDPAFDPHYFEHDIDLETFVEQVKFARKVAENSPYRDNLESTQSLNPGPHVQTDEQIKDWIKENMGTTFHTVGPLSMLPREKGGVVDPRLKVYGTTNIRVADISIVPLQTTGHTQSTAYVIGEKAADIIKGVI